MFVWRIECEIKDAGETTVYAVAHREMTRLDPFKAIAEALPGKVCTRVISARRVGVIPAAWHDGDPWYREITGVAKAAV
jgi:hypothetical protein